LHTMTINSDGPAPETNGHAKPVEKGEEGPKFMKQLSSMASAPRPPKFSTKLEEREWLKFRLAQVAFRIFAHLGFDDGVAGHITVRDPIIPNAFWVNPFGVHFGLITPDILLLVDHSGQMLEESGPIRNLNKAAFMIHSALHVARPDVLCAAHSHSIHGRAFSTLGRPLEILTQNDCVFHNDHVLYDQFNGVVLDEEEGNNIAEMLGPKKHAVILQNHGLIALHESIEAAVFLFKTLEQTCECQLLALSAAAGLGTKPVPITLEEADKTHTLIGTHEAAWFGGLTEFKWLEHNEEGKFGVWNGPQPEMRPIVKNQTPA